MSIADALWLRGAERETLPADVAAKVADPRNSDATRGEQMRRYLAYLLNHPLSHTPDLTKRYEHLLDVTDTLTPQQAYVMQTSFLGPPSTVGYDMIPREANLQFPRDHEPKLRSQVGWHFFVGSCWDADGNEYGAELMFFGTALYPRTSPPGWASTMWTTRSSSCSWPSANAAAGTTRPSRSPWPGPPG